MTRFFDRGAITAAWVGVGMAVTIGISFLLVIPIEAIYTGIIAPGFPVAWLAGLTIGYYANGRSNRHGGPWGRIIANALLAGAATAVTFALLFLGVKALFFAADNGYRDASTGGVKPGTYTIELELSGVRSRHELRNCWAGARARRYTWPYVRRYPVAGSGQVWRLPSRG